MSANPRDLGFLAPPEWAPHGRCWMAWPCREEIWPFGIETARRAFAEVARAIAEFEPVTMICRPDLLASASLELGPGIGLLPMPLDDSWMRDIGPAFVVSGDGRLAGVTFRFNGWGGLVSDFDQDARLARRLLDHLGLAAFESPLVLEGGAISVDGEGTCLVCEPSILDPKRNPGATREQVEAELARCLGVARVIWLPYGLVDDETGGHVDNVARFVRPGTVVAAVDAEGRPNEEPLRANLEVLKTAEDARGRRLEVLELPLPKPLPRADGRLLTASYVNFYLANGAVLVPAFADPKDALAEKVLAQCFPDRQVIRVDARDIVQGGGGIHCITLDQPQAGLPAT
ncbi:Putative agmatine deiminase [bacterium HR40]|nr:Putative agmatine deiminase [bacterium HR40]